VLLWLSDPSILTGKVFDLVIRLSVSIFVATVAAAFVSRHVRLERFAKTSRFKDAKWHVILHLFRDHVGQKKRRPILATAVGTSAIIENAEQEVKLCGKLVHEQEAIFREQLNAPCVVEIVLCHLDGDKEFGVVIARSSQDVQRARNGEQTFEISAEKNTAFVTAREPRENRTSHYYSGDLPALARRGQYHDERREWSKLYNARIVVPIRFRDDEVGFVSVDTMAGKRLNGAEHVELVAAFADALYVVLESRRAPLWEELRLSGAIAHAKGTR
jgi:hypothetical protein